MLVDEDLMWLWWWVFEGVIFLELMALLVLVLLWSLTISWRLIMVREPGERERVIYREPKYWLLINQYDELVL